MKDTDWILSQEKQNPQALISSKKAHRAPFKLDQIYLMSNRFLTEQQTLKVQRPLSKKTIYCGNFLFPQQ